MTSSIMMDPVENIATMSCIFARRGVDVRLLLRPSFWWERYGRKGTEQSKNFSVENPIPDWRHENSNTVGNLG